MLFLEIVGAVFVAEVAKELAIAVYVNFRQSKARADRLAQLMNMREAYEAELSKANPEVTDG